MMRDFGRTCWICCFVAVVSGCSEQEQVRSYKAPKENVVTADLEATPQRILGAILPANDQCWFLKMTGNPADVEQVRESFETFATSVDVSSPAPTWELPAGWQEGQGDDIRYKTIHVPVGETQLALTVTSLPLKGELDPYLLSNVNRWRDQLNLPDIQAGKLFDVLRKVPREGKSPLYLCDLRGTAAGDSMAAPPFASGGSAANSSQASRSPSPSTDAPSSETEDFREQPPAEWQPGELNFMRRAAYQVVDGNRRADVTLSTLSAAGADVLANVNRWRGQVELPAISGSELAAETKELEIEGKPEKYFVMHGASQSLLVVMVPRGERVWFIKLMGDSDLVRREQERFEQYARTIQLK